MSEINKLAKMYKENPTELIFNRLYEVVKDKHKINFQSESSFIGVDPQELEAAFDDVIIECLQTFKDNFEHLISSAYKTKKKELMRNDLIKNKYIQNLKINYNNEETEIEIMDKLFTANRKVDKGKEQSNIQVENQRQLINYFLDKVKDPLTTAIVKEVLDDGSTGKLSPTAIGRKLGVHHSKVTRELAKLNKYYDSGRFGDYRDYLCG